jgi:hypothetical protein
MRESGLRFVVDKEILLMNKEKLKPAATFLRDGDTKANNSRYNCLTYDGISTKRRNGGVKVR